MKKTLSIALICTLGLGSFTSCVKTDESASVTNIRNQKAEQLKSLAALNNANAEARKILSEAEAKLKTAEAAYKQAEADGMKLDNELQQIAIDKAKATLELDIKAAKLKAEAAVKAAEAAFEQAKANLIAALDQVSEAEKTRITILIGKAGAVLTELNTAKQNLVGTQSNKIASEYDLVDLKRSKEDAIRENNYDIANYKATLAELEKMGTADKDAARKAKDEAEAKYDNLSVIEDDATSKYNAAYGEYMSTSNNMNGSRFVSYAQRHSQYVNTKQINGENVEFNYEDGTFGSVYSNGYNTYTVKTKELEDAVINSEKLATIAKTNLTEVEKVLADKIKGQEYKDAVKALEDAEKAFTEAKTSAEQETARQNVEAAKLSLKQVTNIEVQNVENAKTRLEVAKLDLANIKEVQAALTGDDATKYLELVEIHKVANDKLLKANILNNKARHNALVQRNLFIAYSNVYNALTDLPTEISDYKELITLAEKDNADYLQINSQEALIAKYNSEIASFETEIKALEKQYNDYQAQIDTLVKAQ